MPNGSMSLIVNLRDDVLHIYDRDQPERCNRLSGSIVVGARAEFSVIDTADQSEIMGVEFKPGGARPFLDPTADELEGSDVNLDDVWSGSAAGELRERLLEAATAEEKLSVIEGALLERLPRDRTTHPAVLYALAEFTRGPVSRPVGEVIGEIGLSPRRFAQVFHEHVGLTPKRYSRVQRFQHVLRRVHSGDFVDWADVAMDAGYFDQSHFIHDFRAFSGLNPSAYFANRTEFRNHVPLVP